MMNAGFQYGMAGSAWETDAPQGWWWWRWWCWWYANSGLIDDDEDDDDDGGDHYHDVYDDEFDGEIGEDDEETPKVLFNFEI